MPFHFEVNEDSLKELDDWEREVICQFVGEEFQPDDVFDLRTLEDWAFRNGFTKKDSSNA